MTKYYAAIDYDRDLNSVVASVTWEGEVYGLASLAPDAFRDPDIASDFIILVGKALRLFLSQQGVDVSKIGKLEVRPAFDPNNN